MGVVSVTTALGQYRQLVSSDIKALFKMGLIRREPTKGRVKPYTITEGGKRVLAAINLPLELIPCQDENSQ